MAMVELRAATPIVFIGKGFAPMSQAYWDASSVPTTFISPAQLSASIPANLLTDPGTHQVSVASPAPGGGVSAGVPFLYIS